MDLGLHGRRFVVTGGSRGIGKAIADTLASEGADVAIFARGPDQLDRARADLERHGTRIVDVAVDVSDVQALAQAVSEAAKRLGGLDGAVANAGGTIGGNLLESAPEDFAATYQLNVGHAVSLTQAAVPHLSSAGGGSVVFIASITGLRPAPRTTYAAAKAAEIHLAAVLAQELAHLRIRVNAVSPGSIFFPGGSWDRFQQDDPEAFTNFVHTEFPFGRLGTLEEVAAPVAFLLSDRASWITGANVVIDGGQGKPSARRFTT
ncbi:MAG TPA: SDR family oxidoreductase [Jiangellaceae bacterium]|nr:SDR family oxidoreductase [Jiangellaceae bacterium]